MPPETLLERLRRDPARWDALGDDEVLAALFALQFDAGPQDAALARHALARLVAQHEAADHLGDGLLLAAFLVARLGDPADVWLLWRAREANAATRRGFDLEFLLAAGVAVTLATVAAADRPERDALLAVLAPGGEPVRSDDEVAAFLAEMEETYPDDLGAEDDWTLLGRAIELGDVRLARSLLDGRELHADRDELRRIRHYREEIGDLPGARRCARALVAQPDQDPAGRVADERALARLEGRS